MSAEKMGSKLDNEHQCAHVPKLVEILRESTATTLWNKQVQTVITIPNNKPDITVSDNEKEHAC